MTLPTSPPEPTGAGLTAGARVSLGPRALRMLAFLAWRNLWRSRLRSGLTIAAMVVGLTLMVAYLALMEGMLRQMVGFATDVTIGHIQIHREAYIQEQDLYAVLPWPLVEHLREHTPHRYAPRLYAAGLASAGESSSGAFLRGIDPDAERLVTDLHRRMRRGRFELQETRAVHPYGPDQPPVDAYPVVIGFNLARNLQVDRGDELVLITQAADGSIGNGLFYVTGVLQSVDPAFDRMGVLMSIEALNSLMFLEEGVHELAVRIDNVADLDAARDGVEAAVQQWPGIAAMAGDAGGTVRVRTWQQINPPLADMLAGSEAVVFIVAAIVFSIAALGILNTMMMATYERRHELAILLALGMGRWAMLLMVLMEAILLAACAAVLGSLTGCALSWYLQVYGFDYSAWLPEGLDFLGVIMSPVYYAYLLPKHVGVSVTMMMGITALAALVPSWRTARQQPAAALHA